MCTAESFDARSYCERTFLMDLLPRFVKKIAFHKLCRLFQTFYPILQTIKVIWASWDPEGCLEKQVRGFPSTLGRRCVVWPRYSLDVDQFFSVVLPLAIVYYDFFTCRECSCDLGVAQKIFSRVSWVKLSKKQFYRMRFYFELRISLLITPVVISWNLAALRRRLRNSGWLSLAVEMTNFSFSAKFC